MIKTYDGTSQAFTEHTPKIHDATAGAWIEAPSAKAYDTPTQSWIDVAKKYFELSVTSSFYNNRGNIVHNWEEVFHCEIKPTSSTIEVTASIKGNFVNPTIEAEYTFGNSDEVPAIAAGFLSHACITWEVRGCVNGAVTKTETLATGPAYETEFDQPVTKVLNGTFDELRFVCMAYSMTSYENYGKAKTNLDNIKIDGKLYEGKSSLDSY